MKYLNLLWPVLGAAVAFGFTLGCLVLAGHGYCEWSMTLLTPGLWVYGRTHSIAAGISTMALIGALIGTLFGLLTASSDHK